MIRLTPAAAQQVDDLLDHYDRRLRPEAAHNLLAALDEAVAFVSSTPEKGLLAPRPYRAMASEGRAWFQAGRYWFAYSTIAPVVIVGVFYDQADIPRRL